MKNDILQDSGCIYKFIFSFILFFFVLFYGPKKSLNMNDAKENVYKWMNRTKKDKNYWYKIENKKNNHIIIIYFKQTKKYRY